MYSNFLPHRLVEFIARRAQKNKWFIHGFPLTLETRLYRFLLPLLTGNGFLRDSIEWISTKVAQERWFDDPGDGIVLEMQLYKFFLPSLTKKELEAGIENAQWGIDHTLKAVMANESNRAKGLVLINLQLNAFKVEFNNRHA